MEIDLTIAAEAAKRWQERRSIREPNMEKIQAGKILEVETPERVQKRLERLNSVATQEKAARSAISSASVAEAAATTSFLIDTIGFERVLGKSDFLGMDFLELALAVSRFVGRIQIRTSPGRTIGYGTGFMVSPRLLLTNNHVLGSKEDARFSEVEFDYQYDRYGRLLPVIVYGLEPDLFFKSSRELDFALVAVKEHSLNGVELKRYGWNRLIGEQGKALKGDSLNIIQHPKGEAKQIVLRSNDLVDLFDDFAHYVTDTEPGSSGSPVYNDQWEVIALHHSSVPKVEKGNYIAKDGSIWRRGMDPNDLQWVANEGIRVSSLVNYIQKLSLTSEEGKLRDEMLNKVPPHPLEAAALAAKGNTAVNRSADLQPEQGTCTWTIPLQVSVRFGTTFMASGQSTDSGGTSDVAREQPVAPVKDTSPGRTPETPTAARPAGLSQALKQLEDAQTEKYYDEQADSATRNEYYDGLPSEDLGSQELYARLSELVQQTHTNILSYNAARHQHLYPRVDLRPNMKLQSIYTGEEYDPEELIQEDFEITESLMSQARERLGNLPNLNEATWEEHLAFLEAAAPYNAEHVVPQSWFGARNPMKADLHHLFTCESVCNSFRGNTPYFEYVDFGEVIRQGCGKREGNRFEPSQGHGPVARATLYFLLRYPGEINRTAKEYTEDRIQMLLAWHDREPVTEYERHRNATIHDIQGNRNPLIDFPEWATRIDFTRGLG